MELTEKDLDLLIRKSIKECKDLPNVCTFGSTIAGENKIFKRIKEHIFIRGIDSIDTCLALIEEELSQPYIEPNNIKDF
tara:strand:- start:4 stop:240 length:237 start_codon:yes stop_codon:yes gene_type:complete